MTADYMDCRLHMAGLSFLPLGPWNQVAGQSRDIININRTGQNSMRAAVKLKKKKKQFGRAERHAITDYFNSLLPVYHFVLKLLQKFQSL